jgi:hypothetical protein
MWLLHHQLHTPAIGANRVICCIQRIHFTELNWRSEHFVLNYRLAEDARDLRFTFRFGCHLSNSDKRLPGLLLLHSPYCACARLIRELYYITALKQQASFSHQ